MNGTPQILMEPTIEELQKEIEEKSLDLKAFCNAREIVRQRVLEVRESKSVLTPLGIWSGTDAVLGSLDLAIHAMERTIDELKEMLRLKQGTPLLRLVRGDKYEN